MEQPLIAVPQNVKKITNTPVQLEPVVFTTPIPLPLKIIAVQEVALSILVPVPLQLTMTEVLTGVTRRETCIGVMV